MTIEDEFLSVAGLREGFLGQKSTQTVSIYVMSCAYLPLRHMNHGATAPCSGCGLSYTVGDIVFKPKYARGQAIYDLHCPICKKVTPEESMAESALALLCKLPAEDLAALGLAAEPLSESESDSGFVITSTLAWLDEDQNPHTDAVENS